MDAFKAVSVKDYSDEDLMEYFQNDHEPAFTELVRRYQDRLHNFLYRYTHDHQDCEDLVQETFLRVHKSKASYERIAKFSTWMYTIALNLAKSLYKKKQRMYKVSIHKDPNDSEDFEMHIEDPNILPDQQLHEKLSLEQLEKALMSLPDDFREVVMLRDLQEMTYEEISEMTGIPMGTVKSRINRGRAQVQHMIESYVDLGTSF
ncbi:MAG TPA: RNA polymerase subunit sigma-24 [Balneola sp.]|jgi:RNA polymerase sigma-70 factor (ECF subfamily)|nr:RNA polymerase subunit sigma-24 [Bacteroidota bacterium]HCI71364.1 RNA polymerase subunit sigma-24 [Balneola sp.]HCT53111.1 RNA polymerase subunit sigma-24 [Balneola sp.]|tara:strand:+ start:382 stop:993 length:612 start_codon:yes stop_codon:yes gene_type:complete